MLDVFRLLVQDGLFTNCGCDMFMKLRPSCAVLINIFNGNVFLKFPSKFNYIVELNVQFCVWYFIFYKSHLSSIGGNT